MKKKIAIIGAGITGLTLGYLLKDSFAVTLYEKNSRPGGWIRTLNHEDFLFELGPRSCRPKGNGRYTLKLIEELNLTNEIIKGSPTATKRYLFVNQKLQSIPSNPFSFIASPLTRPMTLSLLKEPWIRPSRLNDETIHNFTSRRFGNHAANTLFNPMTLGIYAGDIHRLSMKSCFPLLHEWEQKHRSVIRGAFKPKSSHPIQSPFIDSLQKEPLFTFRKGMETLTQTLSHKINDSIHYNTSILSIQASKRDVTLQTAAGLISYDHLFLCIPSRQLKSYFPDIPTIETASVVTASIGFKHYTLRNEGFGHLVPSSEGEKILGVVWDSSAFPEQNQNPQETRLTVMMGGAMHPDIVNLPEGTLENMAIDALKRHLKIHTYPDTILISRAKHAIPQYTLGHEERVKEISSKLPDSITILGNSFNGVAINDCIAHAYKTVCSFIDR